MQASLRAWVLRAAQGTVHLRDIPTPVLLSLLCASALSPLLPVVAGLGDVAVAASTVLSSIGGGALSGIIASAADRARGKDASGRLAPGMEERVAVEIGRVLAAGDAGAEALRAEIAVVLQQIDAGGTVVRAALEEGDERIRRDIIGAVEVLGADFAEMRFLIGDVAVTASQIQESLDVQGADIRAVIEQNRRQSADIRLFRDDVAVIARWSGPGMQAGAGGDGENPRWTAGVPVPGLSAI